MFLEHAAQKSLVYPVKIFFCVFFKILASSVGYKRYEWIFVGFIVLCCYS